jgi:hypothetical protein
MRSSWDIASDHLCNRHRSHRIVLCSLRPTQSCCNSLALSLPEFVFEAKVNRGATLKLKRLTA